MIKRIILSVFIALTLFACGDHNFEDSIDSDLVSSSSSKKFSSSSGLSATHSNTSSGGYSSSSIVIASSSSARSSSSVVQGDKCGTSSINYEKQFCYNDKVYTLCSGSSYDPAYEKCQNSTVVALSSASAPVQISSSSSAVPTAGASSSSYNHYGTAKNVMNFTFDDIQYWVGEGENRAMLIVQLNDGKTPTALAWGYKWKGDKYGIDMIDAIARADKRFFYLRFDSGYLGSAIAGIGFDISGDAKISNGGTCQPPVDGSVDADRYDFDDWKLCAGTNARWGAGWYEAYWSYWVSDNIKDKWEYSGLGASSRVLKNSSIDAWYFDLDMNDYELSTFYRCMETPEDCDGRNFFGDITPVKEPR